MARAKKAAVIQDDVAVRKDVIDTLFDPPIARSTFYKKVDDGVVVKCRGIDGYYRLNATRAKLGLPQVDVQAYRAQNRKSVREVAFTADQQLGLTAVAILVPEVVRLYPLPFFPISLTPEEEARVMELAAAMKPGVEALESLAERLFFAGGVVWAGEALAQE